MSLNAPNPYQPPAVISDPLPETGPQRRTWTRHIVWTIIFAANLPLPLFAAIHVTPDHGRRGMALAVFLVYVLGLGYCFAPKQYVRPLLDGGFLLALTQLLPVVHLYTGDLGIQIAAALGGANNTGLHAPGELGPIITSEAGGFIATSVTAGILIAAAAVTGAIFSLPSLVRRAKPESPTPD